MSFYFNNCSLDLQETVSFACNDKWWISLVSRMKQFEFWTNTVIIIKMILYIYLKLCITNWVLTSQNSIHLHVGFYNIWTFFKTWLQKKLLNPIPANKRLSQFCFLTWWNVYQTQVRKNLFLFLQAKTNQVSGCSSLTQQSSDLSYCQAWLEPRFILVVHALLP